MPSVVDSPPQSIQHKKYDDAYIRNLALVCVCVMCFICVLICICVCVLCVTYYVCVCMYLCCVRLWEDGRPLSLLSSW